MVRSLGVYALIIGIVILGQVYLRTTIQPVAAVDYQPPVKVGQVHDVVQGTPTQLTVARLGMSLPVQLGSYDSNTNSWTLSDTAAFFATNTDKPNDYNGSTLIYGHNRASVFSPLSGLAVGDIVKVTTDNGHIFSYNYSRDAFIKPDDTSILDEHPDKPQLILMTCDGIWSTTRRVMYFNLVGVDV
jgi:LPXTG-site transpeptidase (sortase) family protein